MTFVTHRTLTSYAVRSVPKLTIVKMAHFVPIFRKFPDDCCHHRQSFKPSSNVAPKVRLSSQTSDYCPDSSTTVDCRGKPSTFVCKHLMVVCEHSTVVHKCSTVVCEHPTIVREHSTIVHKHPTIVREHSTVVHRSFANVQQSFAGHSQTLNL